MVARGPIGPANSFSHDPSVIAVTTVGILGGTSLVGRPLIASLSHSGHRVLACSRHVEPRTSPANVTWHQTREPLPVTTEILQWVALCPPWATVDSFDWLCQAGCNRLVALSSTSVSTKKHSPDRHERTVAERLARAEDALVTSADRAKIELVILRPTMIYDGRSDGNVCRIADFARRFGFIPLCGNATGLRQPVHADDVAEACVAALDHKSPQPLYTLSGGEALMFRDLVARTCRSHGLAPRLISLPRSVWQFAAVVRRLVGLGDTEGIAARMNDDLSCDHADAFRDLGFRPRRFEPAVTHEVLAAETFRDGVMP